jgi:hypothetical protein
VYDINGTPVSMNTVTDLSTNVPTVFSYVRGLPEVNFGVLTPLVVFMFVAMVVFLFVKLLTFFFLPLVAIFGFMRRIWDIILQILQVIVEFIPL